jgi:hypothetical protein
VPRCPPGLIFPCLPFILTLLIPLPLLLSLCRLPFLPSLCPHPTPAPQEYIRHRLEEEQRQLEILQQQLLQEQALLLVMGSLGILWEDAVQGYSAGWDGNTSGEGTHPRHQGKHLLSRQLEERKGMPALTLRPHPAEPSLPTLGPRNTSGSS